MVVVVAIVIVLVTLVVPAASALWRDRRIADAQNTISGQLMSARARALQGKPVEGSPFLILDGSINPPRPRKLSTGGESGLFFFVDEEGVQRIVSIVQTTPENASLEERDAWANVFTVMPDRGSSLPSPMRAIPRYAVCEKNQTGNSTCNPAVSPQSYELFSPAELAHGDVYTTAEDQVQRHRNFFALIYSPDGQLLVKRDVLIRDIDADFEENPGGDVTGLTVRGDSDKGEVKNYFRNNERRSLNINPGAIYKEIDLVADADGTAINFPSVDGLLVYDESLFAGAGSPDQQRKYLVDSGWPFYVHRLTGAVIRGPVGEAVAQSP